MAITRVAIIITGAEEVARTIKMKSKESNLLTIIKEVTVRVSMSRLRTKGSRIKKEEEEANVTEKTIRRMTRKSAKI